jgi:hypothetical protein
MRLRRRSRGQALLEFALVFPIFFLLLMFVIVLGLYVFYNQQLENAAREGARYAAVHSTTAQCPTVSRLDPSGPNKPNSYFRCDAPEDGWPRMVGAAKSKVWGMNTNGVSVAACWSGYIDGSSNADAMPSSPNTFTNCTINRVDPRNHPNDLGCPAPSTIAGTTVLKADGDDKASSLAFANGLAYPTTVTVYACYRWTPPLSGFLFVPSTITLRAVITEAMQRQQ